VQTGKLARIAAAIALCGIAAISGCQRERQTGPATRIEPPAVESPEAVQKPEGEPAQSTTAEESAVEPAAEPNDAGQLVDLVLAFTPGQTATYKAVIDAQKSVGWIGPESAKPAGYSDGYSGNHIEMTFEQRVEQVQENGNAILAITIKGLKSRNVVQSRPVFEFDSDKPEDQGNPLAALVGKSYRLEISPKGRVAALLDMESIRQAVKPGSPAHGVAARLLSDEILRDQHEIPPLTALKESQARPGQSWSDLRSFSFGTMGDKSFERVYTFAQGDGQTAVVEMKGLLSSAMAEELHKRQSATLPPGLFDDTQKYEGRLVLDAGGQVREYVEEMQVEWVIADPAAMQEANAQPRALRMGAKRAHRLELVE
jgi:hypothetical protein